MKKRFLLTLLAGAAAYVLLPLPGLSKPLQKRIDSKRAQVSRARAREGVLTRTIRSYSARIAGLEGEIRAARHRLAVVQRDLDAKRTALLAVRGRLAVARDRLERARRELMLARRVLAARLIAIYKADEPDLLTVILESDGFDDLLERTDYMQRISRQDQHVFGRVRTLKREAQSRADELAALERQAQSVAVAVLRRRDDIGAAAGALQQSRGELRAARGAKHAVLASVRRQRVHAQEDLASLEREQARIRGTLLGAPGPIRHGSGRLIWPVNGPITGTFGEQRPGHLHAGIDIAAPTGTPIHAADGGRVAIAGWVGGYGNYTCIQHTGSLSTCYGHQSRIGVSVGQSVRQGQVIGAVGSTGHSTGAHLHFEVRINGNPVNPLGYL